jgi:Sulfocyanin (SoxE) domain
VWDCMLERRSDRECDVRRSVCECAAYNRSYQDFNLNGYATGEVDVIVPVGWAVTVRCLNTGLDGRHSCAIVRGPNATHPALARAATPD